MKITVLGGSGAWPVAGQACSGYLVEHNGFVLLVDPGYATLPALLALVPADRVDAVFVSHGHPDHCADLNPLLRARVLLREPAALPPPLPVHTLPGAVDAVLALDEAAMLAPAFVLREFAAGDTLEIGPWRAETALLPHFVPNAGLRLTADDRTLVYTGDTGPSERVVALARDADLVVAEASFPTAVPDRYTGNLTSAREAGVQAAAAGAGRLLLTHLWPGIDRAEFGEAAAATFAGPVEVATPGHMIGAT